MIAVSICESPLCAGAVQSTLRTSCLSVHDNLMRSRHCFYLHSAEEMLED